ncbi:hypothetical protein [Streptomyces sp. Z26]|uniref:hypothetical protein n=1 Tax=Streptomyces sp. Z26 TaxID=2500177 RepID=UPI000EF14F94|nr:hypothetical protein [Streptomyces sp. Z26]RLL67147.1 hypothetical protein D7M15_10030 [Streptomyces sp. Z26]
MDDTPAAVLATTATARPAPSGPRPDRTTAAGTPLTRGARGTGRIRLPAGAAVRVRAVCPGWVLLGTALVAARAPLPLGPYAPGGGHGPYGTGTLAPYAPLVALLCVAGVLAAVAATARALPHLPARPVVLLAACALAWHPPVAAWLTTGVRGPLYALAVALLTAALVRGVAYGRLLGPRTAVAAGLLAACAAGVRHDAAGFTAAYPLVVLLRLPRGHPAALLRAGAAYAVAVGLPWCAAPLWRRAADGAWGAEGVPRAGSAVVPLLACAVLGLALTRGGRGRRLAGALLWQAERPYVRGVLTVAVGCAVALSAAARPDAAPGPALAPAPCVGTERPAEVFTAYAHRLGLARSTVVLAAPEGTPSAGRVRVMALVDEAGDGAGGGPRDDGHGHAPTRTVAHTGGRTDPRVAAAYAAHDMRALRRHVLERVRPEFVRVDAGLARTTGLTPDRLAAHGYHRLLREHGGGDYVHRGALTTAERLPELRRWARATAQRLSSADRRESTCG